MDNYAISLFSIVDQSKVDLQSPQLQELAERLGLYLSASQGIASLDQRIEILTDQPFLILNGVQTEALPQLFALADVQRTQLFRYHRESPEKAVLTPIAVKPQ